MGSVGSPVIRRIVAVARGPERHRELLESVGLGPDAPVATWIQEFVEADAYYGLLEQAVGDDDHGLPFRYAAAVHPDDLGALGLAMKTSRTLQDALERLVRYILVLSDTLEYELVTGEPGGSRFVLRGRPFHRRGAQLANECALAAITSMLRRITEAPVRIAAARFRHGPPKDDGPHRRFFDGPVAFDASEDALVLGPDVLAARTRLGDAGLSAYILAHLDALQAERRQRPLVDQVRSAILDSLPEGPPDKDQVGRRLGMSSRTLHRRLREQGETFQGLVAATRREAAEGLLAGRDHALSEVAFLTGFSDQSAFTRAFKRWTGSTPLAYRQQRGEW